MSKCIVCETELVKSSGGGINDSDCPGCKTRFIGNNWAGILHSIPVQYCYGCKKDITGQPYAVNDDYVYCLGCIKVKK